MVFNNHSLSALIWKPNQPPSQPIAITTYFPGKLTEWGVYSTSCNKCCLDTQSWTYTSLNTAISSTIISLYFTYWEQNSGPKTQRDISHSQLIIKVRLKLVLWPYFRFWLIIEPYLVLSFTPCYLQASGLVLEKRRTQIKLLE